MVHSPYVSTRQETQIMDTSETTTAADLAAYEAAVERFNRAAEHAPRIRELCRQLADAADAEYDAAAAALARYESFPGVPKPEYRTCGFGTLDAEAGEPGPSLGSDQNDLDSEVTS
jgi:hypothetical protein